MCYGHKMSSGVNETRKPMKKMSPKKVINEIDDSSKDLIDIDEFLG